MAQTPPTWLNASFLASVLQSEKEHEVDVVEFTAVPAAAPGNNYTSYVFRTHVKYTTKQSTDLHMVSLIVKAPIEKGFMNDLSEKTDFFSQELKMYSELLPKMSAKVKTEFGPKWFNFSFKDVMVFNDLKSEGYVLCDRFKQLDFPHCKLVFSTLAKFHAASVACHYDNPELVESLGEESCYREGAPLAHLTDKCIQPALKFFIDILNQTDDHLNIVNYISKRIDNIWESLLKIFDPKSNSFNVLNHGDCWVANMMFRHNDIEEPTDVKLIDYQVMRYTTPAIDLLYFLWTSANEDVRENKQQDLYNIYIETLNNTLEELGCEQRLTEEELQEGIMAAKEWALVVVFNVFPCIVTDTENVFDMESYDGENFSSDTLNDEFNKMYHGKNYQALLPGVLRQFEYFISS